MVTLVQGLVVFLLALSVSTGGAVDAVLFKDSFCSGPGDGWFWVREHREAWRTGEKGLEILIEPGNMWGPSNDAKNVLVRELPALTAEGLSLSVHVENSPTSQYEQTDLVWYYDDSNMVKIGLELVNGQLSLVMGREEKDKTRTICIIPMKVTAVELRLTVRGRSIHGDFRTTESEAWRVAGDCDLPATGAAKASLQAYQGAAGAEHWACFSGFEVAKGAGQQ